MLPNGQTEESILTYDFNYYMDPDFNYKERWDYGLQICGLIQYKSKDSNVYLYMVPEDILSYDSSYKNRIGYIIEYNN